jgi:2-methylcitrate dehydratase PrpD
VTAGDALTKVAEWISGFDPSAISPSRFEHVKQHIVDTVGACLAGSRIAEGKAISRVTASEKNGIGAAIIRACAQARCTEVDDIHLSSCTTPGAVVVPTALVLAAGGHLRSARDCCAAVLAGYEAMIRFGIAIDGPTALHHGVWPTHAGAAFSSAATASRAYALGPERTAGALATSLAFGSGPPIAAGQSSSARWLTLGIAAANGELAARAARDGLLGASGVAHGAASARLTRGIGRRYLFDDVGMKPFPTARQGLAAIEAARQIAEAQRLAPGRIDRIVVSLPELQRRIVDRRGMPESRFDSIVNVRYQIALALTAPDRLTDVGRTPPFESTDLRRLMSRVRIRRARDLDSRYPRAWPARVEIDSRGRRFRRLLLYPRGDAHHPFGWDQVEQKFVAAAGPVIGESAARRAIHEMRDAQPSSQMPPLWDLM